MKHRRSNAAVAVTLLLIVQCIACMHWAPQKQAVLPPNARHQIDRHALTPAVDYSCKNDGNGINGNFSDDESRPSLPKSHLASFNCVDHSLQGIGVPATPTGPVKRWLLFQSLLI